MRDRLGRVYTPAVGPRLRPFLWIILIGFALLGANGVYLSSVTALTWSLKTTQQTPFYMLMVALHLLLGFFLIGPFLVFGLIHLATSWRRPNKAAVRFGLALLSTAFVILVSGLVLVRLGGFEVRDPTVREAGYWLHVLAPLVAIVVYVKHRLAGPRIRWVWAKRLSVAVAGFVVLMGLLHFQDPRSYGVKGPKEGKPYFYPSEAITSNGKFIPPRTLMMDDYCMKCHQDAYNGWFHSAHHLSSFNNPAYRATVRETRRVSMAIDNSTHAARWCAGCHDPVPFFSGEFDNPNYDDVNDPTSQSGITCTTCHGITNINNTRGNAAYTIEEPQHYPFAFSDNPILQWINNALVKAKPEMHKKTFFKEVLKDPKFCSTCHKVGLPVGVTHYKDFVRGQNHYDSHHLSGVSGHGARSFYYPEVAKSSCNDCHMELKPSADFGAKDFDGKGGRKIHDHLFLGANTGLAALLGNQEVVEKHARFLSDKKIRVDIFGLREGGVIEGNLLGPLRPEVPTLKPRGRYLAEVVVRTLQVGHPFSQGTTDSNEIWVELIARSGGRVIGRSGGINPEGAVDPYSHFINVYMLDREGNRIDRRNPQDIFVPLYNKQIPPGAGQVVHFALDVPQAERGPITLEASVNYRKFDRTYMDYIYGKGQGPKLPVVVMARDQVQLPVEGGPPAANDPSPIEPSWQRSNDYGIGLLLEGSTTGGQKGELKQAEQVFLRVAELGPADGWVNLARVYQKEGRIPEALTALEKASRHEKPAAPWVINWLSGQINFRNGDVDAAIQSFVSVLNTRIPERKFDFSLDYEVNNELAAALYARARSIMPLSSPERLDDLKKTIAAYRRTLAIDSENVAAHHGLGQAYGTPPWGETRSSPSATEATPVDEGAAGPVDADALVKLAASAADGRSSSPERRTRALRLVRDVARFVDGPRPRYQSRLEPLHELVEVLGPAWDRETDPATVVALGRALEVTHERLQQLLRPDETAEGKAFAKARKKDPAANHNAQPIVIHSLHRPGAPLIDPPVASAGGAPGAETTIQTSVAGAIPAHARENRQ
ncbi:MAG: multiheme c-type cytochrome [Isosphaerales bacterium]